MRQTCCQSRRSIGFSWSIGRFYSAACCARTGVFLFVCSTLVVGSSAQSKSTEKPPDTYFGEFKSGPSRTIAAFRTHSDSTVQVFHDGQLVTATASDGRHFSEITIVVTAFDQTFTLKMRLNRHLFMHSSSYVEKTLTDSGVVYHVFNAERDHCYYTGNVEGVADSTSAVSTCQGINGYFLANNDSFHIESVDATIGGQYRVFRDSDNLLPSYKCGLHSTDYQPRRIIESLRKKRAFNWPQDQDGTTKVVELYVVNDHAQYVAQRNSSAQTFARTKDIINIASSLFQSQDIYLVLVGIEVWADRDQISIMAANSTDTLTLFSGYKQTNINPIHPNDNAHLISGVTFANSIVGLAYVSVMCTYELSCGLTRDFSPVAMYTGTILAHELGHNFGLIHDTDVPGCTCSDPTGHCVMYPEASKKSATRWSECSKSQLATQLNSGFDYCLHNVPLERPVNDTSTYCGNGIVEDGEQCDCGQAPSTECNPTCCNPTTCQLTFTASCASGRCCNVATCQLLAKATECREATSSCDLAEYCSGVEALCPSDVYRQDGTACTDSTGAAAYCYAGSCKSQQSQCQLWWGSSVTTSVAGCYERFNLLGTQYGNCGFNSPRTAFYPCALKDVACGVLHCDADPAARTLMSKLPTYIYVETHNNQRCTVIGFNAFNTGGQRLDPGLVPNGAKCGEGLMCLSQRCVSASSISVPQCPSCNQHGVCNSIGQCHCDAGFSPPNCSMIGLGGSTHSGPILPYVNATIPPRRSTRTTTMMSIVAVTTPAGTGSSSGDSVPVPLIVAFSVVGGIVVFATILIIAVYASKSASKTAAAAAAAATAAGNATVVASQPPSRVFSVSAQTFGNQPHPTGKVDPRIGWYHSVGGAPAVMTSPSYRYNDVRFQPVPAGLQPRFQVVAMDRQAAGFVERSSLPNIVPANYQYYSS